MQGISFYLNALDDWGLTTLVSWECLGVCVWRGQSWWGCEKDAGFGSIGRWMRCRSTDESEQGRRWDATKKSRRAVERGSEPERAEEGIEGKVPH